MPIITLTSDLGLRDYYVASVKAAILSQCPGALIVDISHQVDKFNILQAAFILGNSFRDFPEGTIHIMGVMPEKIKGKKPVAIYFEKHYFIGADNGIFPLLFNENPEAVFEIDYTRDKKTSTFPMRDIFAKAACFLAEGGNIESLGKALNTLEKSFGLNPVVKENVIRGMAIYIDDFGNVIVNIPETLFRQTAKKRKFSISFRGGEYKIKTIHMNYSDVPPGEMIAFFSGSGFLEIAINMGNASELLGIRVNDVIMVEFEG